MAAQKFKIAVLCHLFYQDGHDKLLEQLKPLKDLDAKYYFNIVNTGTDRSTLIKTLKELFPGHILIQTPHKGRDIGGKLSLLNVYFNTGYKGDLLLFVHDKQSPHIRDASYWVDELLKVFDKNQISRVLDRFSEDPLCGIVCSQKFIQNEYNPSTGGFNCTSNEILGIMLRENNIHLPSYDFVAGTIFWARSVIYENHFKNNNILKDIALLESGNVLDFNKGTRIHAWERFLSWIASEQNYKIMGI
jgi:lipopolysaccharide biosynthesis protein